MELDLTTPALLFPAISLLLLAFTSRFIALAALIRELYDRYKTTQEPLVKAQLQILSYRIGLIRTTQVFGVGSFFFCVLCMVLLFTGFPVIAKWIFGTSLLLLLVSLGLSLREIYVSVSALQLQIQDLDLRE